MHISNQEKQPKSGQPSIPVLSAVISKNQTINTTQIAGLKKKRKKKENHLNAQPTLPKMNSFMSTI